MVGWSDSPGNHSEFPVVGGLQQSSGSQVDSFKGDSEGPGGLFLRGTLRGTRTVPRDPGGVESKGLLESLGALGESFGTADSPFSESANHIAPRVQCSESANHIAPPVRAVVRFDARHVTFPCRPMCGRNEGADRRLAHRWCSQLVV